MTSAPARELIAANGQERSIPRFLPCASIPGLPWLCAYTKPQKERQVEHKLRREGAPAWLPLTVTVWANKQKQIAPIFPRYLFFQMAGERERWGYVIHTEGGEEIASTLRSPNGNPLVVPDAVMLILLAQCAPNGIIYPPEPREVTHKDRVRVETGPFVGFEGICQRTTRDRVWVLLQLFGRPREVPFVREHVELLSG